MNNINGLTFISNFITENEELELLDNINKSKWNTEIRRRTQHYGFRYPYKNTTKLIKTDPIPKFLQGILEKLNDQTGKDFDQIIINEYEPGHGICPHVDNTYLFGDTVVSLSLQSNTIMDFTNYGKHIEVELLRKSIVILQKDARYKWRHGIEAIKMDNNIQRGKRVSITFREAVKI